ncbi:hypothetical protein [Bradyrhizobium sp. HKCCYLS20291]|uniref:hypothetical protein n=1 Tax=Bradyrhizobium sp. HKCCYLS20291 TaxID=3420766 RepID=UPI003EBEADEF
MTRRSILAATLIAMFVAHVSPAAACSSLNGPPSEEQLFAKATSVFVAHVTSVAEIAAPDDVKKVYPQILEASIQTIEVIKGQPPAEAKVKSLPLGYGNCTLPLLAGADYIFFFQDQVSYVTFVTGSAGPILNLGGTEVRGRLEKLRSLAK